MPETEEVIHIIHIVEVHLILVYFSITLLHSQIDIPDVALIYKYLLTPCFSSHVTCEGIKGIGDSMMMDRWCGVAYMGLKFSGSKFNLRRFLTNKLY